jgi:hypothetical protein
MCFTNVNSSNLALFGKYCQIFNSTKLKKTTKLVNLKYSNDTICYCKHNGMELKNLKQQVQNESTPTVAPFENVCGWMVINFSLVPILLPTTQINIIPFFFPSMLLFLRNFLLFFFFFSLNPQHPLPYHLSPTYKLTHPPPWLTF